MGSWGHISLSLAVEIAEWSLLLSSSESVLLVCDGEEHGLPVDMIIVGGEGSGCVCCLQVLAIGYHSVIQGV